MANDSLVRLKLDSGEYENKIKHAQQGLLAMERECRKMGGTLAILDKDQKNYVRSLGQMETKATTVRGKMGELSKAYTELRAQYNRLTAEEKRGDFGKALNKSLEQLRTRTIEAKNELGGISKELSGNMSGALSDIAGKFGINSDLMGVLTTGTMAYTAAITAAAAAVAEAAKAWAEYNSELGKQDQITSVTTGLKGNDAKAMTDQVRAIAQTYNVDFREAINAANTLMTQFGLDGQKSLNLLKKGMQGMIQGDGGKMLSMIQQYAPAFRDAGIEADQLVAIIHNTEGGIFTDQNMNAIVMGIKNIRLMKDTTKEAMQQIGIDADTMAKKLNDGTMSVFEALRIVSDAIEEAGSGSQAAGEIMNDVFGKQGVAAGTKLGEAIANLNLNLDETSRQTGNVGTAMSELEEATERLNAQMRNTFGYDGWEEMEMGLKTKLYNAITNIMKAIEGVENAIGAVMSAFATLSEYIGSSTIVAIFNSIRISIENAIGPLATAVDLAWQLVTALSSVPDVKVPEVGDSNDEPVGKFDVYMPKDAAGKNGTGVKKKPKPTVTPKPKATRTPKPHKTTTTTPKPTPEKTFTLAQLGLEDKTTLQNLKLTDDAIKSMMATLQQMPTTKTPFDYLSEGASSLYARIDEIKAQLSSGDLGFAEIQKLSEELKGLEKFDLRTTKSKVDKTLAPKEDEQKKTMFEGFQDLTNGMSQMVSSMQQLGIDLPEGITKGIGVLQGIMSLTSSILTIVTAIEAISAADALIPFHTGGLVHAANGVFVPGAYNGGRDTVPAILSPGELVLNAAQQSNLATQLQSGAQQRYDASGLGVRVRGEDMYTALDNYMRRTGKRFSA